MTEAAGAGRIRALDGVRGWAALAVVIFHMSYELFGEIYPAYRNSASAALFDGTLAVSVFFVLSGAALSASFFREGRIGAILDLAIKRHPRLSIPIFFNTLLILLTTHLHLTRNVAAGELIARADWLGRWLHAPGDLQEALRFSFLDVYLPDGTDQFTSLDPFLWTMRAELIGSFVVFACLAVIATCAPLGWGAVCALFAYCLDAGLREEDFFGYIACFLFGMALSKLYARGLFAALYARRWVDGLAIAVFVATLALDGQRLIAFRNHYAFVFGCVAVLAILSSRSLDALMRSSLSQWLGRLSFPLFLVQFPVIVSLSSGLIVLAHQRGALNFATSLAIVAASVAASLLLAVCFAPVERLTHFLCALLLRLVGRRAGA
jgi:peptidoglycan/LPS O-acetylase OafA/YrhL